MNNLGYNMQYIRKRKERKKKKKNLERSAFIYIKRRKSAGSQVKVDKTWIKDTISWLSIESRYKEVAHLRTVRDRDQGDKRRQINLS
jgi:hypothetical protein